MRHIVRIAPAMLAACLGAAAVRGALGFDSEFLGPGLGGLFDVALVAAVGFLVSFSDREYFWPTLPDRNRNERHTRATR